MQLIFLLDFGLQIVKIKHKITEWQSGGFGARSAFGIRGLKIILDGVPLTTPDGQSQVDNIPFYLIENVEIMKSLSSTRYGNASGGVISINTFSNLTDKYIVEAGYGSYGYKNIKGTYSTNSEKSSTILNLSLIHI